jgi:hypothetical protein
MSTIHISLYYVGHNHQSTEHVAITGLYVNNTYLAKIEIKFVSSLDQLI